MSTIHGYIRVKETNQGIPDLLVSVRAGTLSGKGPKEVKKSADPFALYPRSLGSTITDTRGGFRIEFSCDSIATSKTQRQLMLAVMAPSASQAANKVAAAPPAQRVLHWSELPDLSGDQSEAVPVLLGAELLKQFDIKGYRRPTQMSLSQSAATLVDLERESLQFNAMVSEGLVPLHAGRIKRKIEVSKAARKFAENLRITPRALRGDNFVMRKTDAEEFKTASLAAMKTSMDAMAETRSSANRPLFWEEEETMATRILVRTATVPTTWEETVEVDHAALCDLLNAHRGGPDLTYVRTLLEGFRDGENGDETGGGEGEGQLIPAEPLDPSEEITARVRGQLAELPVGVPVIESGEPNPLTLDEINEKLPDVSVGAGPTEITAFHDFHHLQIAFEHVWTEAFDQDFRERVSGIYEAWTELQIETEIDSSSLDAEVQDVDDLKALLREIATSAAVTVEPIPNLVVLQFNSLTIDIWQCLSPAERAYLLDLANQLYTAKNARDSSGPLDPDWINYLNLIDNLEETGAHLIANAQNSGWSGARLFRLIDEVKQRLDSPYLFTYYAPNFVNFGLLLSYRQTWEPGPYQVGDLVSTIPLAPGEKRKFTAKQVVKRSRAEVEVEKSMSSRSRAFTGTQRTDAEIVEKASMQTNFNMSAQGTFKFGFGEIQSGSRFELDQAAESSRVKKDFREAVVKAAQEYKQEHSVEVKTSDEVTTETTTSGEIANPNNELAVTYLLYELERQFTISERIHRVTPVILVAQDVPAPNEITEAWLLAHEWILRRVILDDGLLPALDYITDAFAGEELGVAVRKATWEKQVALVTHLEATVKRSKSERDELREKLIAADEEIRRYEAVEDDDAVRRILRGIFTGGLSEMATSPGEVTAAEAAVLRKTHEDRLKYLEEALAETQGRLVGAEEALNEATNAYTSALEGQTNRRVAIDQLRIHVKENILYYMQAIWDHEPPDQRFFRLADVEVALPESTERTCRIRLATADEIASGLPIYEREGSAFVIEDCDPPEPPESYDAAQKKKLVEIADLDRPLGYKGNYIIFPLTTCLHLTDFMMRDWFDDYFGVRDPDLGGNYSVDELVEYAGRLLNEEEPVIYNGEPVSLDDAQRAALQRIVLDRLQKPRRDKDLVVVPTGQLYMEALLGSNPLLENFKMLHRQVDVAKARAELRETELENLRRAARLLKEEPNLEDPDVDKRIVVEGGDVDVHVETP